MASTSPIRQIVFTSIPNKGNTINVPTTLTGTAVNGIKVARHPCKKTNTVSITNNNATTKVTKIS